MDDIVWTDEALQDLDDIGAYIALDNPQAAETVVRCIVESVASLSFFPRIGRAGRNDDTPQLVITSTPYIAVDRL